MSSPRTYSTGAILKNTARFMTLPTPSHREREREKEREREREREKEEEGLTSSTGSTHLWPRKGSRHGKSKTTTLQKQHSLDNITDDTCKPASFLGRWFTFCMYCSSCFRYFIPALLPSPSSRSSLSSLSLPLSSLSPLSPLSPLLSSPLLSSSLSPLSLLSLFSPSLSGFEVNAVVSLDNKEVDQTKWSQPTNRAWEQQIRIDLHQVMREGGQGGRKEGEEERGVKDGREGRGEGEGE